VSQQYGVDDQTDAFYVANNGQLYVSWVNGAGGWNGPAPISPQGLFPPGAAVAASPQYGVDGQTDVFALANNGQLHVSWGQRRRRLERTSGTRAVSSDQPFRAGR
jgi:hypothetical protein